MDPLWRDAVMLNQTEPAASPPRLREQEVPGCSDGSSAVPSPRKLPFTSFSGQKQLHHTPGEDVGRPVITGRVGSALGDEQMNTVFREPHRDGFDNMLASDMCWWFKPPYVCVFVCQCWHCEALICRWSSSVIQTVRSSSLCSSKPPLPFKSTLFFGPRASECRQEVQKLDVWGNGNVLHDGARCSASPAF